MKHLLKCVIFLLMAVYANATIADHRPGGGTGTQSVYFAESDSTTKTTTLAQSARGEFSLDVIYDDDVPEVTKLLPELHWDSRVLEYVGVSNVNMPTGVIGFAASTNPELTPVPEVGAGSLQPKDDGNDGTDMVILPSWLVFSGGIFGDSPVRLFTITFRWKEAASQTDLTFTHSANDFNADHFDGTGLAIQTIPTAPTSLIATAGTVVDTIDLSWSATACVTPPSSPCITAYRVEYFANGGSSWVSVSPPHNGTTTTYRDTSLSAGTTRDYRVLATNPTGTSSPSGTATATTGSIPTAITLTATPDTITEAGGTQSITITATFEGGIAVTDTTTIALNFTGTATSTTDYGIAELAPHTIIIPARATTGSTILTITPVADSGDDDAETIIIDGIASGAITLADAAVRETTITIRETRLDLSVATLITSEDGTTSSFTAALLTQPTHPVTVAITSSNISEGTVSPASLVFTVDNWQTTQTVMVTGQNDNIDDNDQSYRIELVTSSADSNYNTSSTITVTNTDDDNAPTAITLTATPTTITEAGGTQSITITATFEGGIAVTDTTTIALNFTGTATSTTDYGITESAPHTITIPARATSGSTTLTITPVADTVADDAETIIIDGSASGAITLTDSAVRETTITIRETGLNLSVATLITSEDGTTSSFTAALLTQPTHPVTVAITSSNISEGTVSPASLVFTVDNWQTTQTVMVTGQNDNIDDNDQSYRIELVTSSADSNYNTSSTITVTNTDDDNAPTAITLTATPTTITEAGGTQSITITATFEGGIAVTDTTTIALNFTGTATSTTDYGITESAPHTITIPARATSGSTTLTITPVADTVADDAETIIIDGIASGAITLADAAVRETTITIRETRLNLSVATLITSEDGTTSHFTAALLTQPTHPVTVAITSSNISEGTVSPDSLTFTADNWQTAQTVTVTGQNDNIDDNDQSYRIELVTSSADSNYNTSSTITVTNTDDDNAPTAITLTATPDTITEAGGTQSITITATFEGGIAVTDTTTIALNFTGTATSTTDYGITESAPHTITIPARATTGSTILTITPVADGMGDDAETIIINGSASGAITLTDSAVRKTTITIRETGLNLSVATLITSEDGTTSSFTAALLTQPTHPVTVAITSSNISEGTVSPDSLTFTADNWQTAQTVTVTGQNDNIDDNDQSYRIELVTSSADSNYNTSSTITVTNTDDDNAPTAITLTATPATITEAGGTQSITITATFEGGIAVTDTTTIALDIVGSATNTGTNPDYGIAESAPRTITIPAGATTGSTTLTITPVADTVADDAETIIINGSASGAITLTDSAVRKTTITIRETGLNLSVATLITSEDGTTSSFTAALLTQPTHPVTVAITSSNISEGTVSPASLVFTVDNWQTTQTVMVTGQNDNIDDNDQSYRIELVTSSADSNYNTSSTITVTNTDDDNAPTAITLTATPATITEAGGTQSITITATFEGGIAVTDTTTIALNFTGTATSTTDYGITESAPHTITIPARATSGSTTLTITPVADTVADDAETIIIDGSASGAITLADAAVRKTTITIRETRLDLSVATLITSEDGTTSSFTAALLTQPTHPVTVAITSSNISEGTVSPASLTFTRDNWQTTQTVTVTGQNDNIDDNDQSYRIELVTSSADSNYNTSSTITVTNTDDDNAPTAITLTATPATITEAGGTQSITITATFEGGIAVTDTTTIALNFTGTATSTTDYGITESAPHTITIPAGATTGSTTLTITPVADSGDDDAETIIIDGIASGAITLADAAVRETTITIRETRLDLSVATLITSEDGTTSSFTAALLTQPTAQVTVAITSSNISEGTVSPASLVFTADNWQTTQTVTVAGQDDNLDDGDQRYRIELVTSSADSNYNTSSTITVTNTDDDNAPTAITLTATPATITEAGGTQSITITATFEGGIAVTDTTTIALNFTGTATSTTDYGITESAPHTITIPARATSGSTTLTITPVADTVADDAETIIIDGSASGAITLTDSAVRKTTITIRETGLNLSVATLITSEDGTTSSFTAALLTQPTAQVTVAITSSNQSEGTVSPASLTFTADNWQTAQTVTVTGQNDNIDDNDQSYRIELVTSSADSNYNTSSTITVTNTDDDNAPTAITLTATPATITEVGGTQSITITATFEGGIAVTDTTTIALNFTGTATSTTDYGITESAPHTITIPARATTGSTTLTITPVADTVADDAETIIIDGSASGAITLTDSAVRKTTITIRETRLDLSVATLITSENGTTSSFTAALLTQPTHPVTVAITSSNISEGTVSPDSLTFTADNWQTAQTVTVTGQNDNIDDNDQSYRIELVTSSADSNYNTSSTITVTNTDDDNAPTAITLTATPDTITEAGGTQSITITATFEGGIAVTDTTTIALNFAGTASNTGTNPDYGIAELAPHTITIPARATTGSTILTITPVADTVADDAESIIIDGSASGAITPADAAVRETTITIRETGLNLSVADIATSEDGTTSRFTAALLTQPTDPVTVAITSSNQSEGTVSPASLTFTADNWQTAQTVTVTGQNDNIDDNDQSYRIELVTSSADSNYNTSSTITVTNTDDDNAPTAITLTATPATITEAGGTQSITITATFEGGIAVTDTTTIALNFTGTATSTTDYGITESAPHTITIPARATSGSTTLTITPVADTVADDAETIIIDGSASGAITLTDSAVRKTTITIRETGLNLSVADIATSEDGTTSHFTAALLTQPTAQVTVAITSSNQSEGTVSPASLTFTADNWQTAQTVTVTGQNDNIDDNDQSYRIELVTSSADSNYNTSSTITVTNTDDDNAPTAITLTATPATITEAGGTQSITITATFEGGIAVTDTTTIALNFTGTATSTTDYGITESTPTITIPARATSGSTTLTITPVADTVADDAETIIIDGSASGAITLTDSAVRKTTITIRETRLDLSVATLITSENGTTSSFTAALLTQPTHPVTVAITSSNISEGTVSPDSLTFTADNWQTAQTVTVTGQNDNIDDNDQSYRIELVTSSADSNYNTSSTITVTNTDDDNAPTAITLTATPDTITEAGGTQSITITATFEGGIAVTDTTTIALNFAGTASNTGTNPDYGIAELAPHTITIPARATTGSTILTITPVADTVADDAESIIIDGSASGAITPADAAVRETTITIRETGLNLSVADIATSEDGTTSRFTAALLTQPTDPVTVAITSSNPSEGTVSPDSLTFTRDNWQTTQTVTVAGQDDNLDDGDQRYRIELVTSSADPNYNNTSSTITATNTDNDDAPTAITLTATPAIITEAGGEQSINITATFDNGIAVTDTTTIALNFAGSASNTGTNPDYGITESAPHTITIPARATTGSTILTITPVADTVADDAETIIIDGNASGAITLAAVSETTITIVEKTLGDSIEMVNKSVLPHISQAIVASTLSSIEGRMNATRVGAPQTAGYNLNGQPSLLHNLQANAKAIQDGTFDWRRMMANSSFVLPLAEVAEGGGLLSSASLWADGHYSSLKGDSNAVDWDGDVFGLQIGADTRLRDDLLVGIQASWSQGDFDYTETSAGTPAKGEYNLSMTSLNPYMAWDTDRGLSLWGSVGYGEGELEVEQQGASGDSTRDSSDISQSSLVAGIKQRLSLLNSSPITLSLKSDFTLTRIDIKGSAMRNGIKQQTLNSQRLRLLTEGEHERRMDAGRRLVSTVEMGMRYDSSNGGTYGIEMDVGLRYLNPAAGLTLEGRADIFSSDEYSQWGINGLVRLDPKSDGRGLTFSLNPRYGVISDGVQKIWQQKPTNNNGTGNNKGNQNGDARIDIHLGYGLRVDGLLTPYGEATLGNSDSYRLGLLWKRNTRFNLRLVSEYHGTANDYRLNLHWTPDSRFDFNLTGERLQDNNINHVILLKGRVRF